MNTATRSPKMYYFPDRLRRQFDQVPNHPLTVVEAPSGFGKTTAVREYLKDNLPPGAKEYWYTCLGEPASMAWMGICELISNVDEKVADDLRSLKMPTLDTLFCMASHLRGFQCATETYLVVDNYQLVNCDIPRELISVFSMHGNPKLHMIFITQQLETRQQISIHNSHIHTIDAEPFFFDRAGTAGLFRMEGIRLSDDELENVYISTEGWVSALCLHILNFKETGSFNFSADIEQMVEHAIWNKLTPADQDFLLSVSVMDSFTDNQAAILLDSESLPDHIADMVRNNDFIRYLPDKHQYSIHGILLDYLRSRFYHSRSKDYQSRILLKAGQACAAFSQYCEAARFFYQVGDFDAILSMPFSCEYFDSQINICRPELIEAIINECPDETLCKYPFTMLVFGYQAFAAGQMEAYRKLCGLLEGMVRNAAGPELRRIKGEYTLLASMADYNDIGKMTGFYKTAWEILGKPSEIIKSSTMWGYMTPSVLNILWREPGELENALRHMDESSAIYRKLTRGQGAGAKSAARAEAMLMRGEDDEAEILCHKAIYEARNCQQVNVCLCAELVLARIAILRGDADGYFVAVKNIRDYAKENASPYVLRITDHCMSLISLVLDIKDDAAPWVYDLDSMNKMFPAPSVPFAEILCLWALLKEKRYNEFYGVSRLILDNAENKNTNIKYVMPQVYHLKFLAVAKQQTGDHLKARESLAKAFDMSLPDKIYLPLAQNISALSSLLETVRNSISDREGFDAVVALGARQQQGAAVIKKAILTDRSPLTPREREIAQLAKERLSAREIAEKLYISDMTVRATLRSVYSKLDIHSKAELAFKDL